MGDTITVKVMEIDKQGRINLSEKMHCLERTDYNTGNNSGLKRQETVISTTWKSEVRCWKLETRVL